MNNKEKTKTLHKRFKDFLETLTNVENIDNLPLTQTQKDAKKADYFAKNRQLVIELKSLETDTEHKVEKILEPHYSRPEFPHFFGGWEVSKILKHLPDGNEINRQLVEAVTSALKEIYRSANKQIRTTKETFDLPDSQGLLIILNERIDALAPEHIVYQLRRVLGKTNPDKSFQYPNINHILIFSEAHYSPTKDNLIAFPVIQLPVGIICEFQHTDFAEFILKKWTEYNNIPVIDGGSVKAVKELNLRSVARSKKESERLIPRHESWRRYYRRNPYFRSYDEKKLIWMYKMIMSELTPGLLKGATQRQKEGLKFWGEVFTHFIEEVNYRGMDFRIFQPISQELGEQIDREMRIKFPDLDGF